MAGWPQEVTQDLIAQVFAVTLHELSRRGVWMTQVPGMKEAICSFTVSNVFLHKAFFLSCHWQPQSSEESPSFPTVQHT